jgi:hypothetical protein
VIRTGLPDFDHLPERAVNEAYVLMAIILCVWLLVKLLPGMEP